MEIYYFTKKDMISFGKYLLSDERKESFKKHPELKSLNIKERLSEVHHADVENWFSKQEVKLGEID